MLITTSDSLMPDIRLSTPPFLGPDVNLTTLYHMRTREQNITVWIKFMEPVVDFDLSKISIKGGKFVGELVRQVISGYPCVYIY